MTTKKPFSSSARKFDLNHLKNKMKESSAGKKSYDNDKLWNVSKDKAGNGEAVIRFLPGKEGDYELPYVRLFNHSFEGPGGWLIENCPTTLGKDCPVCEANRILYSGTDDDKKIASDRKRRTSYYANILVVEDKANPSNEGKVFLFRFGKKIFDMLMEATSPEDEDTQAINPFALDEEGANFKLKVKEVANFPNYDKSKFGPASAVNLDNEEVEAILEQQHSLSDLISPDKFKPYSDLKLKLEKVTKQSSGAPSSVEDQIAPKSEKSVSTTSDDDDTAPWESTKSTSSKSTQEIDPEVAELERLLSEG